MRPAPCWSGNRFTKPAHSSHHAPVNRPARKHAHLAEKVAEKQSRSHKKPGKRTKRWRKWLESYQPLVA